MPDTARVTIDRTRLDRAPRQLAAAVAAGRVSSGVLAVANRDGTVLSAGFAGPGLRAVDVDSIHLLASISKPIMAVAILRLVEDGLVVLDQPIASVLATFDAPGAATITPWHLLTHTSGLPEIDWSTALRQYPARAVGYRVACEQELLFEPGTRWAYSTLSFFVLAELVRQLTGLPYAEYLSRHIFAPLGMRDTSFDPRDRAERMVPVRGITADTTLGAEQATDFFISLAMPGAGLWSTASDLVRLGRALLGTTTGAGPLLAPATIELMTREHTAGVLRHEDGNRGPVSHGLGWRRGRIDGLRTLPGSEEVFEHDGAAGGELWIDPAWDLVVVYLTSELGAAPWAWRSALSTVYSALHPR